MPAVISRALTMLILMSALALHNGLRIGPVTLVDELRARYAADYARVGNVIGAYNTGGQLAASLGGPLYGWMLDRGLGFGAVWGTAAALGVLRVGAVLALREERGRAPGAPRP
jgi:predicted MFS family arabinose efflux permease